MTKAMLNTEIYSIERIEKTRSVYSNIARIGIKKEGKYIVLTFDDCAFSEELTMQEFENYLIAVENVYNGYNRSN